MDAAGDVSAGAKPMKCVAGETGRGRRADVSSSGTERRMETAAAGAKALEASGGKAGESRRAGPKSGRAVDAPGMRTG